MYFFMTLIQGNVNFLNLLDNVIILILTTYILYGWASKNSITKVMQYQRHIYTQTELFNCYGMELLIIL